jgi:hypothetical protein
VLSSTAHCVRTVCKIQKGELSKRKINGVGGMGRRWTPSDTQGQGQMLCVIRTMKKGQVRVICDPCKGHAVHACTDKHHADTTSTISVRPDTMKIDSKNSHWNSSSRSVHSISNAGVAMIVSVMSSVATLMVRREIRVVVVTSVDAGTTLEGFLHLRLGAGATSKVSITTNGRKCGRSSGEVVIGYRGEASPGVASTEAAALVTSRME